jgi:hypothetical protein
MKKQQRVALQKTYYPINGYIGGVAYRSLSTLSLKNLFKNIICSPE